MPEELLTSLSRTPGRLRKSSPRAPDIDFTILTSYLFFEITSHYFLRRWAVKQRSLVSAVLFSLVLSFLWVGTLAAQEKAAPDVVTLKLEGAKMAPVAFPHKMHIEKAKVDCAVCHHKDKDPKQPESCLKCHQVKEVKDNAPVARDAFHNRCQTCHKQNVAKGVNAPTKCTECHKK
jgi:hypothetical protein